MARVTKSDVAPVIAIDDDLWNASFITTANVLTNRVAAKDEDDELSATDLKEIERYLAAHFYALRDPQFIYEAGLGASANYQGGQPGQGLLGTWWGANAVALDTSGYLQSVVNSQSKGAARVGAYWLGLPPSEQTAYEDRD